MHKHGTITAGVLAACALGAAANGAIINLSSHSSDETPASWLSATLEFEVSGSTLSLTVTNDTFGATAFKITDVYFNAASNVASVTALTMPSGWNFSTNVATAGFGIFDFGVSRSGNPNLAILPGASLTFLFSVAGSDVVAENFISEMSTIPPGGMTALAAARFRGGPEDDSATGAYNPTIPPPPVPAPAAVVALFGGAMIAGVRRRR